MAEIQEDDVCNNPDIPTNLERMFNNKKYSDSVFFVNKRKFYASSHLVSVSSVELSNILEDHFENCGDREIKIGEVKHIDSFIAILKFIYGLDFELSQMNKSVLCEVLTLAERFELKTLFSKLKSYFSKLDCFQVDFIVVLLNAAKKFKMIDLYENLTSYAYENAGQLVKHESFPELQYDVLLDLVKANFFCTDEVNILKGALNWHAINMSNSPGTENDVKVEIDEEASEEGDSENKELQIPSANSSKDIVDNVEHQNQSTVKTEELVKEFSTNVLKSLLSNIRFSNISVVDVYKIMESTAYKDYKEFLVDSKYFSTISEPRIKNFAVPPVQFVEKNIKDVSKKFSVKYDSKDVMYESNEEHVVGDMKWKVCAKYNDANNASFQNTTIVTLFVKCMLNDVLLQNTEWKCKVECQIKMIPADTKSLNLYLPGSNAHSCLTLTSNKTCVEVGDLNYDPYKSIYFCRDTVGFNFEVNFKSINCKVQ